MFSASTLLFIGTWAAVVLQATAIPHSPLYARDCPVAQYLTPEPTIENWNKAGTDTWLDKWWTEHADSRTTHVHGFAGAFGDYAVSKPNWSCQDNGNTDTCSVDACNNDKLNALGDDMEQAFYLMQALNNLHGFFIGLEQAFGTATDGITLDTDAIVNNFWHDENNWNALALKEILNMLSLLVGLFVIGLSAPAFAAVIGTVVPTLAAAGSTMFAGGVSGVMLSISPKDSIPATQSDLGHLMAGMVPKIADSFTTSNNELMLGHGFGNGDIRNILKDGAWLDYKGLDKVAARKVFTAMLESVMINSLWRSQRVFIIGGGACGDGQDVGRGTNEGDNVFCDNENRAWYLYYWQRDPMAMGKYDGWISRPWGSDRMGESPIIKADGGNEKEKVWPELNPTDVIKSSLKSFRAAGYNYDASTLSSRIGEIFASGANTYTEGLSMEGLWTIPVCDISKTVNNPDYIWSMKRDILHPYGYNELPHWCGPICGMDKNTTIEFYKAANFKDDFAAPFLKDCAIQRDDPPQSGNVWVWTTNSEGFDYYPDHD
ncbi:hypothetical protein N7445_007580 [Penicillium cf. griseofulvum]|nr:hypothetical protein N7445_007580 [Penicillium cf. griseofulvum]